jgi:hypothetical protein
MKKLILTLSVILAFQGLPFIGTTAAYAGDKTPVLEIYYFHGTYRCPTCLSIEANTRKLLDTYFKDKVDDGTIKLIVLNFQDKENKALCEKYKVSGSALLLVKNDNGDTRTMDMTNFAFSYSRNSPDTFIDGMKNRITELLK